MPATKSLTVRLPDDVAETLRNYAFVTNTSVNEVITQALADYLKSNARTELVRAAFDDVLQQHAIAFDKLKDL